MRSPKYCFAAIATTAADRVFARLALELAMAAVDGQVPPCPLEKASFLPVWLIALKIFLIFLRVRLAASDLRNVPRKQVQVHIRHPREGIRSKVW